MSVTVEFEFPPLAGSNVTRASTLLRLARDAAVEETVEWCKDEYATSGTNVPLSCCSVGLVNLAAFGYQKVRTVYAGGDVQVAWRATANQIGARGRRDLRDKAIDHLGAAVLSLTDLEISFDNVSTHDVVTEYNDDPATVKADAIAAFDRAIELARKAERKAQRAAK